MVSGIYIIENRIDDRTYVGSSVNIKKRVSTHKRELRGDRHWNTHLQSFFNKYGANSLEFAVLEFCEADKKTLMEREQFYIDKLKPSFNQLKLAYSTAGRKVSEETKRKMSLANKGQIPWTKGRKMPEELRKRQSEYWKNLYRKNGGMPKEIREKISKSKRGHMPWMKGKKHSQKAKEKMSQNHLKNPSRYWLGRKFSEEHRRKLRDVHKGIEWNPTRPRVPNSTSFKMGHKVSELTKMNQSSAQSRRWIRRRLKLILVGKIV